MSRIAPLDPELLITTLARHRVRYILIGAVAARLHGFPRMTADIDITPSPNRKNVKRLAAALRELEAKVFTESVPDGLPFDCSRATLTGSNVWNLVTSAGRLDLAFKPSGTTGYDDLAANAVGFRVFGTHLEAASLLDIIRSKEASDRPQDRQDILLLREMIRQRPS